MVKNEVKFVLDSPRSLKPTHIFLMFTCEDGRLKYSTQQLINPRFWDFELQKAIIDRSLDREQVKLNRKINEELDRFYDIVMSYKESCRLMGRHEIFKSDLKKELNERDHRKVKKNLEVRPRTCYDYINELIREAEEGILLTPSLKRYSKGSIKNWIKSKEKLELFNASLQFEQITLETYFDFIAFCNKKMYTINYTGKLIKDLKTFMTLAHSKNWHSNLIYKHPKFKKLKEDSEQVYLNEGEIQQLYEFDLSNNAYLEKIRDRFIINLYTGLRVSDMKTLTLENFQNGVITHINKKTGKKVVIPVHPIIEEVIKKYNGELPKQYAEQVVNREIKLIAKMAGFIEKVAYSKTVGGIKQNFIKEKWEMISSHSSRRSLTTNLLKYADPISVMPVLGMSLKTLAIYNKRSAAENAEMLKNNKFFQK